MKDVVHLISKHPDFEFKFLNKSLHIPFYYHKPSKTHDVPATNNYMTQWAVHMALNGYKPIEVLKFTKGVYATNK